MAKIEQTEWDYDQCANYPEGARRTIQTLRNALADIAFSKDMTLRTARAKAKRLYEASGKLQESAGDNSGAEHGSGH